MLAYFFVRPKRNFLEACLFLGRALKAPQVRRRDPASKTKVANLLQIRHRDEVETPMTDWLREAYEFAARRRGTMPAKRPARSKRRPRVTSPTPKHRAADVKRRPRKHR